MLNKNLLIVGANSYGMVAAEIAADMGCFEKIDFVDIENEAASSGIEVVGNIDQLEKLVVHYNNIIVAVMDTEKRLNLLKKITEGVPCRIVTLVSPKAYVSKSVQLGRGCIVEPMVVVNSNCVISDGCILAAGSVVNHSSMCCEGVIVDCNATVDSACFVPAGTKVKSGEVYRRKESIKVQDLFFDSEKWKYSQMDISKRTPQPVNGIEYSFDCGM